MMALLAALGWGPVPAHAVGAPVTLVEVPPLAPPDNSPPWTLRSSCVDTNDNGVAACRSVACRP